MFLFFFGRDQVLSKLELTMVFKKEGVLFEKVYEEEKFVIIDFPRIPDFKKLISQLGGTVRIAKVYYGAEKLSEEFVDKLDFYFPKNFNYAVEGINLTVDEVNEVEGYIKKAIRQYKSKGVQKHATLSIVVPSNYFSWKLEEGFELFVLKIKNKYFFAQTLECTNPRQYEYKDNKRPVQKLTRGTSFRLAQMMVNCLDLGKGRTLVDPFCGIGTFLIEGMIAGYNVIGIDNEEEMIQASLRNIEWARKEFGLSTSYKLFTQNAQEAQFEADGCVFEPFMGPFMTKLPNKQRAIKVMQRLEELYLEVFENLNRSLKKFAPVVCVLPYLETQDGDIIQLSSRFFKGIKFDIASMYEHFQINNPIDYDTPAGSRIRRRIYLFKKQ